MKLTKRAKRMAQYLEKELGWIVTDETSRMCDCGHKDNDATHKFCSYCGQKLGKIEKDNCAIEELEMAIKYALEEC